MCGIVGIWNRDDRRVEPADLKPMMEPIRYRGPDDEGVWTQGPIGFGHLRLSILDLSPKGHQPFLTQDGQGVLTYNGEVYNYRELRKKLESQGVVFASRSDTEVVLQALHTWGPQKAIPRFNGMFGLGYLDRRDHTLWLARDRLGIKPLYVAQPKGNLVFASEIKALLAHGEILCRPDMRALVMNILEGRLDNQWAPFEGIEAISPGEIWKVTHQRVEKETYFDVLRELDTDRLVEASQHPPQAWVERLEAALSESVRIHLASDAPLATMCSGGLDSSLVTAMAKQYKPDLIAAYVADVKGIAVSEGAKARIVGEHTGVEIRQVDCEQTDALRLWPWAIWYSDQLNYHNHDVAFLAVARRCRDDGIKVLLTGEGSDELFGGYDQQRQAYRYWRKVRIRHRLTPNMKWFRSLSRRYPHLFPLNLSAFQNYPFADGVPPQAHTQLLLRSCILDSHRNTLGARLFEKLAPIEPLEDRAFLARSLEHLYGHLQSLLHRNDRMAMGMSVESRVPFLENNLIGLGMHMPLKAKYQGDTEKWSLKKVAKGLLPHQTVAARKAGFQFNPRFFSPAVPILKKGIVSELLKWDSDTERRLINQIAQNSTASFRLVGLELWARLFLYGENPEELGERVTSLAAGQGTINISPPRTRTAATV